MEGMGLPINRKQFRRLLDLAYIGNWVLNSFREGEERILEYDRLSSLLFKYAAELGLSAVAEVGPDGKGYPTEAYIEGGIHEAIEDYDDSVFWDILSEELAYRDSGLSADEVEGREAEVEAIKKQYFQEFLENGLERVYVDRTAE